jgi:hypothetical protein
LVNILFIKKLLLIQKEISFGNMNFGSGNNKQSKYEGHVLSRLLWSIIISTKHLLALVVLLMLVKSLSLFLSLSLSQVHCCTLWVLSKGTTNKLSIKPCSSCHLLLMMMMMSFLLLLLLLSLGSSVVSLVLLVPSTKPWKLCVLILHKLNLWSLCLCLWLFFKKIILKFN